MYEFQNFDPKFAVQNVFLLLNIEDYFYMMAIQNDGKKREN